MATQPLAHSTLIAAALLVALQAPAQQTHKFPDHGFRILAPADWTLIPPRPGEQWILAHFLAPRDVPYRNPDSGLVLSHRPRMRVFGFAKRDSAVEVTVEAKSETRISTSIRYPYRDYADYVKRHDHGGGHYVATTEDVLVGGIPVTRQDIKIEKMAAAPRRLLACVYKLPDREIAVEIDVLETEVAPQREVNEKILRSLVITGEAKAPEAATSRPDGIILADNAKDLRRLRDARRRAWRERVLADVQKTLPKGWASRKTKHFLVLNHGSDKYLELVLWQANEIREWLDDNLKNVGEGEVMRSVLRVCKSADEASAYASGSGDSYVANSGEVVCAERDGSILGDFRAIATALLDQYLADRNPALEDALPLWLAVGLDAHVGGARISKKQAGLIFPLPISELRTCLRMIQEGRFIPVDQLMRTEPDASANDRKAWDQTGEFIAEAELFVRYLMIGPGKSGRTKGLIQKTMATAVLQLESRDLDAWKQIAESRPTTTPMTEAEEEEEFQRRRQAGREFAKKHRAERLRLLEELTAKVLSDWKPEDWNRLNKGFESWVKNGLK
jgi:hypothetical protein